MARRKENVQSLIASLGQVECAAENLFIDSQQCAGAERVFDTRLERRMTLFQWLRSTSRTDCHCNGLFSEQ